MRKRVNNFYMFLLQYKSQMIADWLNSSSNFCYLLSTRQQQVVDSAKNSHRFLHFTNSQPLISHCKINVHPGISKRKQESSWRKIETFPARPDFRAETSPMTLERLIPTFNERNFQIPSSDLAYETVTPKKYLIVIFGKSFWLKIKQFMKSELDLIRSLL